MKHYQIFVHDTTVGNRIPQGDDVSMRSPFTVARAVCSLKSFKDHFSDTIQSTVILADADYAEKIRQRPCDPRWRVQVVCLDAESLTPPEPVKWVVEGEPRSSKGKRDNSAAQDIKLDVEPDINASAETLYRRNKARAEEQLHGMSWGTYCFDPASGPDRTAWAHSNFTEIYESVRRERTPIELATGHQLDALGAQYKTFRFPLEADVTYRKRILNKFYGL